MARCSRMIAISRLLASWPPYSVGQRAAAATRRRRRGGASRASSSSHSARGTPPSSKSVRGVLPPVVEEADVVVLAASSGLISRSMNASSASSVAWISGGMSKSIPEVLVDGAVPTELPYEEQDDVGVITLQRPEARNALTHTTYAELEEAVRTTTARCLVITGADPAFCSGDDVKQIMAGAGDRVASGLGGRAAADAGRRRPAPHRRPGDRGGQRRRRRLGDGAGADGRPPGRVGAGPLRRAVREAGAVLRRAPGSAGWPSSSGASARPSCCSPDGSSTPRRPPPSAWCRASCPTTSCCPPPWSSPPTVAANPPLAVQRLKRGLRRALDPDWARARRLGEHQPRRAVPHRATTARASPPSSRSASPSSGVVDWRRHVRPRSATRSPTRSPPSRSTGPRRSTPGPPAWAPRCATPWTRAEADPAVVGIVITGAGRAFCAGADMDDAHHHHPGRLRSTPTSADELAGRRPIPTDPTDLDGEYTYLLACPKPIIAAINGAIAGMAVPIALLLRPAVHGRRRRRC